MDWFALLPFLAACAAAAATGTLFRPGAWYEALAKPAWVPPNKAFPVVWTVIYLLIAAAAARVAPDPDAGRALAFWSMQIALNTLWTPVFFGLHRMRAGLVIICLLWIAVAATMIAFFRVDLLAGLFFVPYLAWVSVAAAMNAALIRMNPA
ncbi:sensory protein TspO [Rhodobacterales bacterium HKCCE2091]|nr:sensory protein TspO [Rhodobacterales bacterium HKCCE2091]